MDKETRGAIEKATQLSRALLEREFEEQLDGRYDIMEHVDPIFFGDPKTAALKALGLT